MPFHARNMYTNPCKIRQQFKKRKILCGHLTHKIREELRLRDLVHVNLIVHIEML